MPRERAHKTVQIRPGREKGELIPLKIFSFMNFFLRSVSFQSELKL